MGVAYHEFFSIGKTPASSQEVPIKVLPASKEGTSLSTILADKEGTLDATIEETSTPKMDTGLPKGADELMFISEGFPPLTSKVVQKIEKGEFVDFGELLPKKPELEESPLSHCPYPIEKSCQEFSQDLSKILSISYKILA